MNLDQLEIQEIINRYKSDRRKLEFQIQHLDHTINHLESLLATTNGIPAQVEAAATINLVSSETAEKAPAKAEKAAPAKKEEVKEAPAKQVAEEPVAKPEPVAKTPKKPTPVKKEAKKQAEQPAKNEEPSEPETIIVRKPPKKTTAKTTRKKVKAAGKPAKKGYRLSDWDNFMVNTLKEHNTALVTGEFLSLAKEKVDQEGKIMSDGEIRGKINRSIQKLANKRGLMRKVPHKGKGYAYALAEWVDDKGQLKDDFHR